MATNPAVDARDRLPEAVRSALRASARTRNQVTVIDLRVEPDGVLVFEGVARTLADKKRALSLAARAGAARIADRIRVGPVAPASDAQIRADLRDLFAREPAFADMAIIEDRDPSPLGETLVAVASVPQARGGITFDVRDGVVTLNGSAPSLARMRLAGVMAWRTPGVADVVNGLAVDPPEEDSADELEEAVRLALECDPEVDAGQVRVGVRDGVVRLTGLVRSPDASRAAEADAWAVLGVEDVRNDLEVRA